jgi:DNA replication protein DnaC
VTQLHQLERTLRTLKLGGMLETLDQRLAQARAGELGHLEFLEVLCQDEIARRQAGALRRRVRRARFESQPPWRTSTSPSTPSSRSPRSATWPPAASSRPGSR